MLKQSRRGTQSRVEAMESRLLLSAAVQHRGVAHPTYQFANHLSVKPAGAAGPVGLTPAQITQAYGINAIGFGGITGNGAGQTIAIIDAFDNPNAASDLASFDARFGLPAPPSFQKLNQNGGTPLPGTDSSAKPNTWELEESLDVQWAHAVAPAANIILYEANTASLTDLISGAVNTARNNPSVSVITMSFSSPEFASENTFDSSFTTPAGHQGITFVAATGDTGSPGGYPSYSPNVLAVGGTTLNVDASGNYTSETAWGSSGGGISTSEAEPSYQQSVQNTGSRTTPDVAMDGNPNTGVAIYDTFDNGASSPWVEIGGTSVASPMWGGLIAIADQGRALKGLGSLDGKSQTLPMLYQAPASDFHDITSGSNGAFSAGPGYDRVTGLGTPVANLLVPALVGTSTTTSSSIFSNASAPASGLQNVNDSAITSAGGVELGMKFRSDTSGYITGVRFWKGTLDGGTHTGELWSNTGVELATATFAGETASGWQQVSFSNPVAISANTTYIVSYQTSAAYIAYTPNAFATSGVDNAPLHALANGVAGGNGVYQYDSTPGTPSFPTSYNSQAPYYWVDVTFSTSVAASPPVTTSLQSSSASPAANLQNVNDPSITAAGGVELGLKFRSDTAGFIAAVRFWKGISNTGVHTGELWSTDGTLLATATFTNETATGWQQVNFSSPVSIAANTTYIVSYHTTAPYIAYGPNVFATAGIDNGPLHALSNGAAGGNGVYHYDATQGVSTFPSVFNGQSPYYWVDVVYTPST